MEEDELAAYRAKHHHAYMQRLARHESPARTVAPEVSSTTPESAGKQNSAGCSSQSHPLWPLPNLQQPRYTKDGIGEPVGPARIKTRVVSEWKKPGIQPIPLLPAKQIATDGGGQQARTARPIPTYDSQVPLPAGHSPLQHGPVPSTHRAVLQMSSSPATVTPPPVTANQLRTDELLARALQEEEDQRLAQRLANEQGVTGDGEPRAPDDPYVERLIDGRTAPGATSPRPTIARNLLGPNPLNPHSIPALYQPSHNTLSAAQATVVGGMSRNMLRHSPLSPAPQRSSPINIADMDEEEQLRYALAQSQKDYQSSRH